MADRRVAIRSRQEKDKTASNALPEQTKIVTPAIEATPNASQTETADDAKCDPHGKPEAVMQDTREEDTAHAKTKEHATDSESGESVIASPNPRTGDPCNNWRLERGARKGTSSWKQGASDPYPQQSDEPIRIITTMAYAALIKLTGMDPLKSSGTQQQQSKPPQTPRKRKQPDDAKCDPHGKPEAVMQDTREEDTAHAKTKEHATDSESGESVIASRTPEPVINVETEVEIDNAETTQTETKTVKETSNAKVGDSDATQRTHAVLSTNESEAAAVGKADDISSTDVTRQLDVLMVSTSELESVDTSSSPQTEPNVDLSPTDATVKLNQQRWKN
ncbi:hypothetical protein FQA39_LY04559 [Lamprigera yunnana]|nr:hypothetical protein FQA39_LY04559 [Lamprigera yunnana]